MFLLYKDMRKRKNKGSLKKIDFSRLPRHIAIIMDGNGRWAKKRGLPRNMGHQQGLKTVREITKAASEFKIPVLTLYAFSVDNWARPEREITFLMKLLEKYVDRELASLRKENVCLKIIGDISKLPLSTQRAINKAKNTLQDNTGLTLVLALNYGSRTEIIKAVKKLAVLAQKKKLDPKDIDEIRFKYCLETKDLPDPDLLIRTSGEKRLSNFLLWQLSYTELYFPEKFWPDFGREDFLKAIVKYQERERRYGGL